MPDDAVVPLADDELEGARLPGLTAARAPASRARGELDATSRDEGAEPQDFFVSQSAMGLPAAGRAHARDECSDRTDVSPIFAIGIDVVDAIQVLFERPNRSLSVLIIQRRARPEQCCNYINGGLRYPINTKEWCEAGVIPRVYQRTAGDEHRNHGCRGFAPDKSTCKMERGRAIESFCRSVDPRAS